DQDGKQLGELHPVFNNKGTVLSDGKGWDAVGKALNDYYEDGYYPVNTSAMNEEINEAGGTYTITIGNKLT
ncbi:hypothetical protein, partial [Lapidilactobacillus dextrinicus]